MQRFSTLRRRIFLPIIISMFAVICIFCFTACSEAFTEDDIIARGYKVAVIYDFGGGKVNGRDFVKIRVKENSKLPEPKKVASGIGLPTRDGYSLKGFYLASTDEQGKVLLDADGKPIPSNVECDFSAFTVENTDITICTVWWKNYNVVLHYGENKTKTVKLERKKDGSPESLSGSNMTESGYTFISYNLERNGSESTAVTFPHDFESAAFENSADGHTLDIWADTIEGAYNIIRKPGDFTLSSTGENVNYYIMPGTVLDLNNREYKADGDFASTKLPSKYNGNFIGNGAVIKNFTINMLPIDALSPNFGLFRVLGSNAKITDVTFENVTINLDLNNKDFGHYNIGMLAGTIEKGAQVSGVKISGNFKYKVVAGYDPDKVIVSDDFICGVNESETDIDCTVENLIVTASTAVYTADKSNIVYLTYTENADVITVNDIYSLATKSADGTYATKTVQSFKKLSDTRFEIMIKNRRDEVYYTVDITVSGKTINVVLTQK